MIVTDFPSIARILHRQEQKAEFEANNPNVEQSVYGYLHGAVVPLVSRPLPMEDLQLIRAQGLFGTFTIQLG